MSVTTETITGTCSETLTVKTFQSLGTRPATVELFINDPGYEDEYRFSPTISIEIRNPEDVERIIEALSTWLVQQDQTVSPRED